MRVGSGDDCDLRQDQLATHLFRLFERLWHDAGLEARAAREGTAHTRTNLAAVQTLRLPSPPSMGSSEWTRPRLISPQLPLEPYRVAHLPLPPHISPQLPLEPYRVVPTAPGQGLVEIVPGSLTLGALLFSLAYPSPRSSLPFSLL